MALLAALLAATVALGGCGSLKDAWDSAGSGSKSGPKGGLRASISEGYSREFADVGPGEPHTLRVSLQNSASAPAYIDSVQLKDLLGSIRILGSRAKVRPFDREGAAAAGWVAPESRIDVSGAREAVGTAVPAKKAVDLLVGFDYSKGSRGRFRRVHVHYHVNGINKSVDIPVDVELCTGLAVEFDGCIEGSP